MLVLMRCFFLILSFEVLALFKKNEITSFWAMSFVDTFSGIMGTGRYSIHSMDTYAVFLFGKRNVHICTLYFLHHSVQCRSNAWKITGCSHPLRWIGKPSPTSRVMAP